MKILRWGAARWRQLLVVGSLAVGLALSGPVAKVRAWLETAKLDTGTR